MEGGLLAAWGERMSSGPHPPSVHSSLCTSCVHPKTRLAHISTLQFVHLMSSGQGKG